jgi:hypothetical protein
VSDFVEIWNKQNRKMLTSNGTKKDNKAQENKKFARFPYFHKVTHDVGKYLKSYNVTLTSRYHTKLSNLITKSKSKKLSDDTCKHKEQQPFDCVKGTVYVAELDCNSVYGGQTSRCPNTRWEEHLSKSSKASPALVEHWKKCNCSIIPNKSYLWSKQIPEEYPRQILETICMEEMAGKDRRVISNPSIFPTSKEREYILQNCSSLLVNKQKN